MKVVGFVGSPREGSNTGIMVEEILNGASEAGAETELLNLSKMDIAPCKACMHCKENNGECGTSDDMQIAYAKIREADAFVLGSPVYMWQMSAQAKLFTDRLFANFKTGFEEKYGQKDMALVFSQNNPDENMFKEYFYYTRNMFDFLGYNVVDMLTSTENRIPGEVKNKKEVMDRARKIGRELAKG
ncbi:flavodoxin family protein [Methanobacterium sp.]|uniref:flavodoxin family protein n=1 Tax=Methanobacterium sp. TaxID=2164 RepID=UPI0025F205BB|nr:flavodoxin family protein [Methanobacterium sp.]MBI5460243.1 flavodoxin family protein [Methanobacterium sp.]